MSQKSLINNITYTNNKITIKRTIVNNIELPPDIKPSKEDIKNIIDLVNNPVKWKWFVPTVNNLIKQLNITSTCKKQSSDNWLDFLPTKKENIISFNDLYLKVKVTRKTIDNHPDVVKLPLPQQNRRGRPAYGYYRKS